VQPASLGSDVDDPALEFRENARPTVANGVAERLAELKIAV
jgi:hypothetical protein